MTHFCSKAMPQAMCQESLVKTMSAMNNPAALLALRLDANLVGSSKVKTQFYTRAECIHIQSACSILLLNLHPLENYE